jgi:hypothetical protein
MFRILLPAIILLTTIFTNIHAQTSLVPVNHPIYDWLYHQRVAGNLNGYIYERLPLSRRDIIRHLHSLQTTANLNRSQTITLNSYLLEFDPNLLTPDHNQQIWITDDTLSWPGSRLQTHIGNLRNDNEKHTYLFRTQDGYLTGDFGLGQRVFYVRDGDQSYFSPLNIIKDARIFGNYGNTAGFHGEINIISPIGDDAIYAYDGFYSNNWISQRKFAQGLYDGQTLIHFEASGAIQLGNTIRFDIGRGNLKTGTGTRDNMLFSANAYPLDWIRMDLGNRWMRFQVMHGSLGWPPEVIVVSEDPLLMTRNSPSRYVVKHTIMFHPTRWMDIGFFEMINYSNRGMEVAYLNPFNIISFAEREMHDQDNGWGGVYFTFRPRRGLELFTELVIDDLRGHQDVFFKKKYPETSRFARRYGLQWVPVQQWRIWGDYERIDPFVYSHPFGLNAHTNMNIVLGSQLAPNSDRLSVAARWLGARRTWVELITSYVRQGRDIYGEDGQLLFHSGWNANQGRIEWGMLHGGPGAEYVESYLFLDGDLHRWAEVKLDVNWEPVRGWIFRSQLEQRWLLEGGQINDRTIFWTQMIVNF